MGHLGKVRKRLALTPLIAGVALVLPAAATAQNSPKSPSKAQIDAAVRHAETSPELWATVNICNTRHHRGVIGIRAQMPALGFAATLRMRFEVDYWSVRAKNFKPVPGASHPVNIGVQTTGLHQGGVQFSFPPHTGQLRGTVRFEWAGRQRLLGHATASTTHGHPDADFGDPAHYSAPKCVIR